MTRIVPAILTEDPHALADMLRLSATFTNYVQVDIMDGKFVPSRSITYEHLSRLTIKLDWEAHLMVQNPEDYLEAYKKAGAKRILFHYEATKTPQKVITAGKKLGVEMGLFIDPDTPSILAIRVRVVAAVAAALFPGHRSNPCGGRRPTGLSTRWSQEQTEPAPQSPNFLRSLDRRSRGWTSPHFV